MEQLKDTEVKQLFTDVRSSFRLLAVYQKRLLELVDYVGKRFSFQFEKGGQIFPDKAGGTGKNVKLDYSGWNWLMLYFFSFRFEEKNIMGEKYTLRVIHQADTGFYDVEDLKLSKLEIGSFSPPEHAGTFLYLALSKDIIFDDLFDRKNDFSNLSSSRLEGEGYLILRYSMQEFINQQFTDKTLEEFSLAVQGKFGIEF